MSNSILLLINLDDAWVVSWVIIIPVVLAILVGLPLYLLSQRRQRKAQEQARDSMFDMPLVELQSQNISVELQRRAFRDMLLSPEAVEWMELLVRRTFQQPNLPENYAFLVDKYTTILKQLVGCVEPWSQAWTAKENEPVDEIQLRATDSQWSSYLAGFDEMVGWVAKLAAEQSRYAARVKEFDVPQWDEGIPSAYCESDLNGFTRSWVLTTRFHGASVAPEISRISRPLVPRAVVNEPQAVLKDGAKGTPTGVAAAELQSGSAAERAAAAVLAGDFAAAVAQGEAALNPLIEALGSVEAGFAAAERRRQAAHALAQLHPKRKRAVKSLLRALSDSDEGVRNEAVGALISIGAPAVDGLCSAVANSWTSCAYESCLAATALGAIGDVRAAKALTEAVVVASTYREGSSRGKRPRSAASALKIMLTASSTSFSEADLRSVADLPDVHRVETYGDREPPDERVVLDVDCDDIRNLARQELTRRGAGPDS